MTKVMQSETKEKERDRGDSLGSQVWEAIREGGRTNNHLSTRTHEKGVKKRERKRYEESKGDVCNKQSKRGRCWYKEEIST